MADIDAYSTTQETKGIEYIPCNLCKHDQPRLLYEIPVRPDEVGIYHQDVWPIVQCPHCGLIYANPRPDAAAMAAYYRFENEVDAQFVQDWFIENAALQRPTWHRFLRALARFGQPGRLIDVGCGAGSFLAEARQQGYAVVGQEVADFFAEYGRSHHNLSILIGELEDLDLADHSFDVATAFDVIEHHPYPKQMLQEMHRLLRPGGRIMISTHDIGNLFARWYGAKWRYINPIGHLTYFNRQTLTRMLQETGFHVIYVGGIHTVDGSRGAEMRNWVVQFVRVILLRALILGIYKPLANRLPWLRRWSFQWRGRHVDHKKLLIRAGNQIIMNDDIVVIGTAVAHPTHTAT